MLQSGSVPAAMIDAKAHALDQVSARIYNITSTLTDQGYHQDINMIHLWEVTAVQAYTEVTEHHHALECSLLVHM